MNALFKGTLSASSCALLAIAAIGCGEQRTAGSFVDTSARTSPPQRLSLAIGGRHSVGVKVTPDSVCTIEGKGRPLRSDSDGNLQLHVSSKKAGTWLRWVSCGTPSGGSKKYPLEFNFAAGQGATPDTPEPEAKVKEQIQPPLKGDPLSYSQSEIISFGYPPRPDPQREPARYAKWLKMTTRPLTRIQPVEIPGTGRHGNPTSNIWSGVVMQGSPTYQTAFGMLTVPGMMDDESLADAGFTPTFTSFWVGLDGGFPLNGAAANDVVQAGIDLEEYGTPFERDSYAWVEWYPAPFVTLSGFPFDYQDQIEFSVWVGDAEGNHDTAGGYAWFDVFNVTKDVTYTTNIARPDGAQFVGNTAEFIAERPAWQCLPWQSCNWLIDPLTNFDYALMQDVGAESNYTWMNLSNDTYTVYDMNDTAVRNTSTPATGDRVIIDGFGSVEYSSVVWFWEYYW